MASAPPYLVLGIGPTASGKSSILDELKTIIGVEKEKFNKHLIDDLMEKNPKYKELVDGWIRKKKKKRENRMRISENCLKNPLTG